MSDIIDVSVGPIIYNKFIDTLSVGPNCPANPGGVRAEYYDGSNGGWDDTTLRG